MAKQIDGLWGKAGGAAPKAGYTQAVGEVDTSTTIRPSDNADKARFKRKKPRGLPVATIWILILAEPMTAMMRKWLRTWTN